MSDSPPAAIRARFILGKFHQGRGSYQMIVEVDEDEAKHAIDTLGIPTSDTPIPVAVALLFSGIIE